MTERENDSSVGYHSYETTNYLFPHSAALVSLLATGG